MYPSFPNNQQHFQIQYADSLKDKKTATLLEYVHVIYWSATTWVANKMNKMNENSPLLKTWFYSNSFLQNLPCFYFTFKPVSDKENVRFWEKKSSQSTAA